MTTTPALLLAVSTFIATTAQPPQKPITKMGQTLSATSTIQAIDQTARTITLRHEDGTEDSFLVPPEVKRFGELKVGDKVKAHTPSPSSSRSASPEIKRRRPARRRR